MYALRKERNQSINEKSLIPRSLAIRAFSSKGKKQNNDEYQVILFSPLFRFRNRSSPSGSPKWIRLSAILNQP